MLFPSRYIYQLCLTVISEFWMPEIPTPRGFGFKMVFDQVIKLTIQILDTGLVLDVSGIRVSSVLVTAFWAMIIISYSQTQHLLYSKDQNTDHSNTRKIWNLTFWGYGFQMVGVHTTAPNLNWLFEYQTVHVTPLPLFLLKLYGKQLKILQVVLWIHESEGRWELWE